MSGGAGVLVIVPTFNEAENIPVLLPRVREALPAADLLIVDDGSPDGTADLVESLSSDDAGVRLLRRTGPRGLGRSYVDGYGWAMARGYDRVVQMDADLSHSPAHLPGIAAEGGSADVVVGSRYCPGGGVRNWPRRRIWLSRFANAYVHVVTGVPVEDSTSGFRCYSADALRAIDVRTVVSNGYAFQVEMTYRAWCAGLSIVEFPITFTDRLEGQSKISRRVLWESMLIPWRLRFSGRAAGRRKRG